MKLNRIFFALFCLTLCTSDNTFTEENTAASATEVKQALASLPKYERKRKEERKKLEQVQQQ